jgi:hypothetical protein
MSWQTKYKFHSGRSRVGFLTRCRRHVSIDLFVRIKSRKVQAISSKKEKKEYKLTTASHGTWDFFCLIFNGSDQDLLKKISHEVYHYAFCCASGYYWNQESVRNLMILRLNPTQPSWLIWEYLSAKFNYETFIFIKKIKKKPWRSRSN